LNSGFINRGTFDFLDNTAVTDGGGFTNSGTLNIDTVSGAGGSSLTVNGTLANTAVVQAGPNNFTLSAPTTLKLGGLTNAPGASFSLIGQASNKFTLIFTSAGFAENDYALPLHDALPISLNSGFINRGTFDFLDNTAVTDGGGFTNSGTLNI